MQIKPNKRMMLYTSIITVVCAVCSINVLLFNVQVGLIIACIFAVVCMRQWINYGRTLFFNKNGIHVSFLCYKKQFFWEDIKLKRYVDQRNRKHFFPMRYKVPYTISAEFYVKKHVWIWLKSEEYGLYVHPLSFIFVHFQNNELNNLPRDYPLSYVVNGYDFKHLMEEWGIEMEDETKGSTHNTGDSSLC